MKTNERCLVSIIIPIYNSSEYLDSLLGKIKKQCNDCIEVILVDDGSKDNSLEICSRYSSDCSQIKTFHKQNEGASIARNFGIKKSKGKYIVFVDSDDIIKNDFIENLLLICKSEFDIVNLNYYRKTNDKIREVKSGLKEGQIKKDIYIEYILNQKSNQLWNKVFRRAIIEKYDLYFDKDVIMGEDLLFILKYLKYAKNILIVNKSLYFYSLNTNGLCCNVKPSYISDIEALYNYCFKNYSYSNNYYRIINNTFVSSAFRAIGLIYNNGYKHELNDYSGTFDKICSLNNIDLINIIKVFMIRLRLFFIISLIIKKL